MLAEFIQIPKEGETIGPYLLRKHISTSIIGSFFTATHKGVLEDVLIHIIPEALLRADTRFQAKYKEVVARQSRLSYPTILAAEAVTQVSGNLIVQYPGGNYRSMNDFVLKRRDLVPVETVKAFLNAIGRGLEDAVKIEQMHLFLTPDFMFLNEDGEVRIAGVGLFQSIVYTSFERFVSGAVIPIQVDKSKIFEAIEILSPEIRNFKKRDQRSDFYCIGMCAYFMLTGSKPERNWVLPSNVREDVDSGWDIFISHCLEPKPGDRFPHYRSFVKDLDRVEELSKVPIQVGRKKKIMRPLERIPVPKRLEVKLGMRMILLVRLLMLGVTGILAIGTAGLLKHIIESDFDQPDEVSFIRRVNSVDSANIIVKVIPSRALVKISGREKGRFVVQGKDLLLFGRSGNYSIEVSAPKRKTETINIELIASKPVQREISLYYNFGSVRIEGAVGTDVYIENSRNLTLFLGTIEAEDGLEVSDRLLKGRHTVIGRHALYYPVVTPPVSLGEKTAKVKLQQAYRPTELVVLSDPEGATVRVGDSVVGLTPLRVEALEVGVPIRVRVEKEGYRAVGSDFEFSRGQSQTYDAGTLIQKVGKLNSTLDFSMNNPPSLDEFVLTVNGTIYPLQGNFTEDVPEGEYKISLSHPDFYTFEQTVQVNDKQLTEVLLTPQPRPMMLVPIIEGDYPARYKLEDDVIELTDAGAILVPSFKRVKVSVTIPDHHDVIQWFEGTANELREWVVPLKRLPGPSKGSDYSPPYFDMPLVWIKPEPFSMGSPIREPRRLPNEDNLTSVTIDYGYWITETEITQDTYEHVMRTNPSEFIGGDLPVDSVNWNDAVEFCRRLTQFEQASGRLPDGYIYRLPTEAEWEYAARANTTTPFSFGSEGDPSKGNFHGIYTGSGGIAGKSAEDRYGPLPVATFPPNPFGLFDVHGNVAEWVLDRFWDRHPGGSVRNPYNNSRGRGHTIRGGSWRDSADRVRTAAREGVPSRTVRNSIGFRVAIAPDLENP